MLPSMDLMNVRSRKQVEHRDLDVADLHGLDLSDRDPVQLVITTSSCTSPRSNPQVAGE